jgi:hypothetical protein
MKTKPLLCCIKKTHMHANDFPMKQLHQTVLNREWTRINANASACALHADRSAGMVLFAIISVYSRLKHFVFLSVIRVKQSMRIVFFMYDSPMKQPSPAQAVFNRRWTQINADKYQIYWFGICVHLLCCIKKSHMRANDFPMKQLHKTQTFFNREWTRINANASAGMFSFAFIRVHSRLKHFVFLSVIRVRQSVQSVVKKAPQNFGCGCAALEHAAGHNFSGNSFNNCSRFHQHSFSP